MDTLNALNDYLIGNHAADFPEGGPSPSEPLNLDSMGMIRLIAFIESSLGVSIHDEEIVPENFETLNKINELIASKNQLK